MSTPPEGLPTNSDNGRDQQPDWGSAAAWSPPPQPGPTSPARGRARAAGLGVAVIGGFTGLVRRFAPVLLAFAAVLGIVLLTAGIVKDRHQRSFDRVAVSTTGVVSKAAMQLSCTGGNNQPCRRSYTLTIDFTTEAGQAEHFTAVTRIVTSAGQYIAIRYDPNHPSSAQLVTAKSWTTIYVLIVAGAVLILFGVGGLVVVVVRRRR